MAQIPKDGKAYLAWDPDFGIGSVWWLSYHSPDSHYYFFSQKHQTVMSAINVARWMDEKGQWHEVDDERL